MERFVLDAMLGKLARDLRALGYDAAYRNDAEDEALLRHAQEEERFLVTRDEHLAKRAGEQGILLRTRDPEVQRANLARALDLRPDPERFLSRCLECNRALEETHQPDALPADMEGARHWTCPACERVYWIGTHAKDMLDRFEPYLKETPRVFDQDSS